MTTTTSASSVGMALTDDEIDQWRERVEDAMWNLCDALHKACVVVAPEAAIKKRDQLAGEALYTILLAMQLGMMEEDTIGIESNRKFVAIPVGAWVAWANPIRDELDLWE